MEYGRPADPMGIPLVTSILLFVWWLLSPNRTWTIQFPYFLLLLCVIAVMGPFAVNSYSIWRGFRGMAVQLLCIAMPLIQFTSSLRRAFTFTSAFLAVLVYAAIYGITHGGVGPGGHIGDENDLALALSMALPFAFVGVISKASTWQRLISFVCVVVILIATMMTLSRGGFLALAAVLIYCFSLILRKKTLIGFLMLCILGLAGMLFAPPEYWAEIATIQKDAYDTEQGTGALRREFWTVARNMFYHNPIFGVGLNNFTWNISMYQTSEQLERAGRSYAGVAAHSLYFTVLAELGVSGFLLFSLILYQAYKDTSIVLRQAAGQQDHKHTPAHLQTDLRSQKHFQQLSLAASYAHAIRASLLGYLTGGAFLSVFPYPHPWLIVALAAGLRKATEVEYIRHQESSPASPIASDVASP
jgi:O-antigen ligase